MQRGPEAAGEVSSDKPRAKHLLCAEESEAVPNESRCGCVDTGPCPGFRHQSSWGHTGRVLRQVRGASQKTIL